jgi:large subunit ribosomal protein L23
MPRKKKVEEVAPATRATIADFDIIIEPLITEKSMTLSQESNKATFKVKKGSNKVAIKRAIEHIYGVKVTGVQTVNVSAKKASRGARYKGTLPGYKKAIVTLAEGQAIDLFKE